VKSTRVKKARGDEPGCRQTPGEYVPLVDRNRCEGKAACVEACPEGAIRLVRATGSAGVAEVGGRLCEPRGRRPPGHGSSRGRGSASVDGRAWIADQESYDSAVIPLR
jgi:NAD-dependent dihydropyrimidine dehydrogenase PreA subunit